MRGKILLADDETNILDVCAKYLEREGYEIVTATSGTEALAKWKSEKPDLIVLDIMMPDKDGWQVCTQIRHEEDIPIIMLTARGEEMDRVMGLTMGADDYVTKPFSPRELVLRVGNIFRRLHPQAPSDRGAKYGIIQERDLTIHPSTRKVFRNGHELELTLKEFDLLYYLASHPDQVFSRNQLLNQIWGVDFFGDTTTVTVHVRRLREKLEENASEPTYIKTVWGIGYKFSST
ncbi:response regulator transcription factor [Brevibacillus nitrificans]|uniref:response regulator transcription factor n=1 Tax=Brevibacillus nitrificans TaxID=651560 RepID=UPI00285BAD2C|nr:response regulator transcription factor [Brevibacillus nitrificans]MDR7315206.1 DNA-binding response OmpR family regulator [Brevibacillus nitrificans]